MFPRLARAAVCGLIACCALSTTAEALPFSSITQVYFFGDSLSDSGFNNLFPVPAGKAPTFTTYGGYTWSQYVARDIKGFTLPIYPGPTPADTITNNTTPTNGPGFVNPVLTGINYACGGSTTNSTTGVGILYAPSLHQEISNFLNTQPTALDPNALYFIWSGANDLLKVVESGSATQADLIQAADTATRNIANEVIRLKSRGARRFVVLSLPSLGSTPLITSTGDANIIKEFKNLSFTFNTMLNTQLGRAVKASGANILYADIYTEFDNMIAAAKAGKPYVIAGQSFTFVNYLSQACAPASSALVCPNNGITNYVFADSVHPSGQTHRVLSLYIEQLIQNW